MTARLRFAIARPSFVFCAALAGLVLGLPGAVEAQQTVTQTVFIRVIASSQASVQNTAAAVPMRTDGVAVAAGTYGIATSESNQKIAASLDRPMPTGTSLSVTMAVPSGASTLPRAMLGTSATDVVTGIPVSTASDLPVSYSVQGQGTTSRAKAEQRVVTYTFTAGI